MSGVVGEMLKAAGDVWVRLITDLLNAFIRVGTVPDDRLKSVIVKFIKYLQRSHIDRSDNESDVESFEGFD